MSEYDPGVCNIGPRVRNNRYILGASGITAAILSVAVTSYFSLPSYVLIFTYIPFLLGFEGVFQALTGFCVHYAQKGVYEKDGELEEVEEKEHHRKDMRKAKHIHAASLISAAAATALVYLSFV